MNASVAVPIGRLLKTLPFADCRGGRRLPIAEVLMERGTGRLSLSSVMARTHTGDFILSSNRQFSSGKVSVVIRQTSIPKLKTPCKMIHWYSRRVSLAHLIERLAHPLRVARSIN